MLLGRMTSIENIIITAKRYNHLFFIHVRIKYRMKTFAIKASDCNVTPKIKLSHAYGKYRNQANTNIG